MNLHRQERNDYRVEIVTSPQLTGWEASFDGGTTWVAGTVDVDLANTWRWLIAGPDVAQGTAVAVITETATFPLVRATQNPRIVVDDAPMIQLI